MERMRGTDIQQDTLFSTVIPEERVPKDHSLRPIREMVDAALKELDADFNVLYSERMFTLYRSLRRLGSFNIRIWGNR
jgi:hypothetical protein